MDYRTDLALERREMIKDSVPDGVLFSEEVFDKTKVTRIEITESEGEKALNKPIGKYITVELDKITADPNECKEEIEIISNELKGLIAKEGTVLVVGLGNNDITPDAIGPKVANYSLATRHIQDKIGDINFRSVAVLSPSVLGKTGIETAEIIKSVSKDIGAGCVVVVDALASKSIHRLGKTVQICNTGICPGSGVNNKRAEISQKTLGIPVIAMGVPTVVDALTIAMDASENSNIEPNEQLKNMMVTPREIDTIVNASARIISLALGRALQNSLSVSDLYFLSV